MLSESNDFDEEMFPIIDARQFNCAGVCKYNGAVTCDVKTGCERCGWNPSVDARRRRKTRARFSSECDDEQ